MAGEIFWWEWEAEGLIIYLASTKKGAVRVNVGMEDSPSRLDYFHRLFQDKEIIKDKTMNLRLLESIKNSLAGKPINNELPLDLKGTLFQMKAWRQISSIPFGETRTYGEVAAMLGMPKAARAVGQAMNKNPLPLIFPCHRVIAANGLGGFGGGLALKKFLLDRERRLNFTFQKSI